ncbi:HAD family hydrolase [Bacillaceae bacterium S4-13-56]
MIKLFVTDLDGTLLGNNHYISNEDISAIQEIIDQGIQFGIATGRMDHEIQEILKRIARAGHRISQNGAYVYDLAHKKISERTFEAEISRTLLEAVNQDHVVVTVSTDRETHVLERNEMVDLIEKQLFHSIQVTPNMAELFGSNINPSKISVFGEKKDLPPMIQKINQTFDQQMDCYISYPTCFDIMPKNINKANAILPILQTNSIHPDELACIGDSHNDIEMLRLTKHSYAISTADPEVKQVANYVVDHVHEAIEDLRRKSLL